MAGMKLRIALILASALTACPALSQEAPAPATSTLEAQFQNPPQSARPRVWWHWMNGNVSEEGIAKDMAWMKRVGIGGLQNFDASLMTPQIVDKRLVYMTPEWKQAFRFTAQEADRLGLELAIAASPGWSETGGPWVPPADGLKKLVWSETEVTGGKRFSGKLAAPPSITGPFQSVPKQPGIDEMMAGEKPKHIPSHYGEVAVIAYPVAAPAKMPPVVIKDGEGNLLQAASLGDGDTASGVQVAPGKDGRRPMLVLSYPAPQTVRSATLFIPGASMLFSPALYGPKLEASDDGTNWHAVANMPLSSASTSVSFAPVTARQFRVIMGPPPANEFSLSAPAPGIAMGDIFARYGNRGEVKPVTVGDFRLSSEASVDLAESKAGFHVENDYYKLSKGVPDTEGVSPDKVIDLTSRMKSDGSLDWTPPRLPNGGAWRVLRLGSSLIGTENHPAPKEATGLEVDKFDGPAVRRYLEHYIGMYRDASGGLIGKKGVQAILTDSIEVGAANWTPAMIAQFKRLRGYDPVPFLPALTGVIVGSRSQSDGFLYDYRRTLADLMASEHYGTVATVAHEHGLKVYGEALENGRPSIGDDMAMRRHADIPMAAMWTHNREEGPRQNYIADIKGAASVAHIYGQNLVAAESLTSAMNPWAYSPASLKRVIDLEFVHGVNRPVIHTSVHQPSDDKFPGLSLFIFGQYFNRHETWAEMAKPWVDYLSRNALMLQQGRNHADVAYFYGEEAPLTALYQKHPVKDAPTSYAYDFINADAITGALSNQGDELVTPGGARYKALYLGGTANRMTLTTLRKLAALAEGGATVIGLKPEGNPGLAGDPGEYAAHIAKLWPGGEIAPVGKGRVIASQDIEAALAKIGIAPDFRFTGGQDGAAIPFLHRKLADGDSYFIVNQKDRTETIEARFRVSGKAPELWRAETGTSEPLSYRTENGYTIIPLTLRGDESVHIVFRRSTLAESRAIEQREPVTLAELSGGWNVAFQQGRGAPATAAFAKLTPLDENADAGIKYFSGIANYAQDFTTPKGWIAGQPLWLDLGEVRELAEVTLNGQPVGSVWHAPFRLDISAAAKRGKNRVEIKVANLWVNRLIGDAQPGAQKITWTAMPAYRADAPLRRSGLIGPVTLLGQGK